MGFASDFLPAIFRWLHIFFGIIWIGLLYFFNFVNGPFAGTLDGDTKKKVVPELMPRALYWFRWGAAWTWITGVLMLLLVFYHGGLTFNDVGEWGASSYVMIALTFLAPFIYDFYAKSALKNNQRVFVGVGFVLIAAFLFLFSHWANFSYRSVNIHIGAMFGTIMAFNVWFRIWPAQRQIISAVKAGTPPDPNLVALAGARSRHNTYLSVPLLWAMMNQHSTYFAGGNWGLTDATAWIAFLGVVALGWHIVWHSYQKAAKVKGF